MKKIALYGLSSETEKAISRFAEYDIVGILDGYKTSGEIYGKEIISLQEAFDKGITEICVVARPGSSKAIAKKIGAECIKNNIKLWDIRGRDLLNNKRQIYSAREIIRLVENFAIEKGICNQKVELFKKRIENISNDNILVITDPYDIGYLFCAPVITDFVFWFSDETDNRDTTNIWYASRDGYLIQKLCEILGIKNGKYILTSRISAIRAGIACDNDFAYIDNMKFSGNLAENIYTRFGIEIDGSAKDDSLVCYKKQILERAKILAENSRKYLEKIPKSKGKICFFDFVAKGTTQYFLQRLLSNKMEGYYFLQLEPQNMKEMNINVRTFYSEDERDNSEIFDNYYILETVLTSPDPSVKEYDFDGNPVFADETRTVAEINCSLRIQEGIIQYFKDYINIGKGKISKELDEVFLKLIHNVQIENKEFLNLKIEDPFFNRMTDIIDVL